MFVFKKLLFSILFFCVIVFSHSMVLSQCDTLRYREAIFENVIAHNDVLYGEAQVWNIPYNNTDLFMDIYEPAGDTLEKRPLMLWVHPGGFLTGDKTADDMVALCDSFAKRGYVTATIGYRLGFNPTSQASGERAVYRGTQDMRAAIRFLKEYREEYRIDTNYTFLGGSSAGGFATLHTAYLDQDEAPSSITGGIASPDLGCLDCSGNEYQHGINLTGIVNLWGAIGDSTWIDADEDVPALLIHGTDDGTVPYGVGHPFGVFTTPETNGSRSVSNQLNLHGIEHEFITFVGQGHEPHGTDNGTFNDPPTPYWDTIFDAINNHYFSILQPKGISITGVDEVCAKDTAWYSINVPEGGSFCVFVTNGEVVEKTDNAMGIVWENSGIGEVEVYVYSSILASSTKIKKEVVIHELPEVTFLAQGENGTYSFTSEPTGFVNYIWNFGDGNASSSMSPSHTYGDAGEFLVSLEVKDGNGCTNKYDSTVVVSLLSVDNYLTDNSFLLYPNPADDQLTISSGATLKSISIKDALGRVVYSKTKQQSKEVRIPTGNWSSGSYYIEVIVEGFSTPFRNKIIVLHD